MLYDALDGGNGQKRRPTRLKEVSLDLVAALEVRLRVNPFGGKDMVPSGLPFEAVAPFLSFLGQAPLETLKLDTRSIIGKRSLIEAFRPLGCLRTLALSVNMADKQDLAVDPEEYFRNLIQELSMACHTLKEVLLFKSFREIEKGIWMRVDRDKGGNIVVSRENMDGGDLRWLLQ